MFIFVLLTLFAEWIWVDATNQISMGLEFHRAWQEMTFTDLDGDGDEDIVSYWESNSEPHLEAFENTTDPKGNPLWEENPTLINGIDSTGIVALGTGDLNGDGIEEIIIRHGDELIGYVNIDTAWEPDLSLFDDLENPIPMHHDFADVDSDGDLDMLGGWGNNEHELFPGFWWNTGTPEQPSWEFDSTYIPVDRDPPFHPGYLEHFEHPNWIDWEDDGDWDILYTQWNWADPPPYWCDIKVLVNNGTGDSPEWEENYVSGMEEFNQLEDLNVLDWNDDGVIDLLITQMDYGDAYHYIPGTDTGEGISYDFNHPLIWGGIIGSYPAAADVNDNDLPELAMVRYEYQMDIWGHPGWTYPCFSHFCSENQEGTKWRLQKRYYYLSCDYAIIETKGHLQYLDFDNDGLIDYVINIVNTDTGYNHCGGYHELYLNHGTKTEPDWIESEGTLNDLPDLFPSCFLDIDGDGDKDVIGFSVEDSVLAGFLNTGSDNNPRYSRYDALVSGLEGVTPTYFAAGDLTDNDMDEPDLAVNIVGDGLTSFFNSGQANPRWHKHEEVFKELGVNGNPALCDADGDGDLDLYLVTGGRLHYYRNESTGGIAETPPTYLPRVSITYIGREVEVSLTVAPSDDEVRFLLYNAAGQRVMASSQKPRDGEVRFRISQQPGVYFYRASTEELEITGKVVLY
jgi:hypothetical protein